MWEATYRPSAAATPSRLLRRPLRLSVEPSLSSLFFPEEEEDEELLDELPVGAPVDFSSRDTPRVNAASKSSRSNIHLFEVGVSKRVSRGHHGHNIDTDLDGTLPIRVVNVLSLILPHTVSGCFPVRTHEVLTPSMRG